MTLPDFLIIGAMKCGTSTLQAQLAAQAGVFMTTPKEPNFFSDDAIFAKGIGWYQALFAAAPQGALKGEASTHYTKLPTHPHTLDRLTPVLPACRIVYMIRNPVDRAVSHYIHEWSMGQMGDAIEQAFASHGELVDYGRYPVQIAPWIAAYGKAAVLITSLEAMTRNPQDVLTRVGAHLGLTDLVWQDDHAQENVSAARVRQLPLQGLLIDNPLATMLRRALVPKVLRDRIRKTRQMTERPRLTPALRARLEEVFAPDLAALETLFPQNPDIAACYAFRGAA